MTSDKNIGLWYSPKLNRFIEERIGQGFIFENEQGMFIKCFQGFLPSTFASLYDFYLIGVI